MAALAYAAALSGGGYLQASFIGAYNLGTGDFTVEAWVQAAAAGGTGTVVARKGVQGGSGNGGFLLVLGPQGALKFATDNGFGYFQVDTPATGAGDGTWHHVAGVRSGAALTVYLDGIALPGTPSGNGTPPLGIDSSSPLTMGATDQTQEPYRFLTGQLNMVTLWGSARSAAQVASDMRSAAPAAAGVLGSWAFADRNGTDSSANHNNAVAVGTVGYVAPGAPVTGGDYAAALGASGSFTAPLNGAYQVGVGDFAVEAWVQAAAAGGSGTVVSRKGTDGGSGNGGFLLVLGPDGSLKLATDNGFGYYQGLTGATGASDGRWHHVAGVRQGANVVLYVDGLAVPATPSGNGAPPLDVSNGLALSIGTVAQTTEPYRQFNGSLAALAFWNNARDAASVWSDMHTVLAGTEAGLIGLWPFSYRNGLDVSPTGNNATAAGSPAYGAPGAPVGWFAAALSGGSYLQAPFNQAYQVGTGDFTVEAWVCTSAPGGSGTLVARKGSDGGAGNGGFLLVLHPDGSLKLATDNGFGFFEFDTVATSASDGTWHFVAGVRQGAALAVFLDGQQVDGQTRGNGAPPLDTDSGQPLTLGTTLQTGEQYRFLTGQLDAVALWSGARSAATIATDMGTRFTGREAGLLGFWGFDFRDGRDTSATRNDAAANGSVTYTPPGAPIGQVITQAPTITQVSDDAQNVAAAWTAIQQPVTGYRMTLFDGNGQPVSSTEGTATQNSVAAPQQPGSYTVKAQAVGVGMAGPWSEPVAVVSAAPAGVDVAVTDTAITASWSAVGSASGYRLALNSGATIVEFADVAATEGQLPLPADRTPAYTVSVRGQVGAPPVSTGPWSAGVPALLLAPTISQVTYDGQAVQVAWSALNPPPPDGYTATVFTASTPVASANAPGTTATIPATLEPTTAYVVRVRGLAAQSQGAWSEPVAVVSSAPAALAAGAIGDQVAARWQAAAGVTGYEAALSAGGTWGAPQPAPSPAITFAGAIVAGTVYAVRVRGVSGISTGPWSAAVPGPFLRTGTVTYDGIGRMTAVEFPGIATTTYTYDADGNITQVTVTGAAT